MKLKNYGNEPDIYQEMYHSFEKGIISQMNELFDPSYETLFYKILQAIDRVHYRLQDDLLNLLNKWKVSDDVEFATEKWLENKAYMVGILLKPYYDMLTSKRMILAQYIDNQFGGTIDSLKTQLYYFINPENLNNEITRIVITDSTGEYDYYFVDDAFDGFNFIDTDIQPEADDDTLIFYDQDKVNETDFVIFITFQNNGDDTNKTNSDYWELDNNLALLDEIIKLYKPIGLNFKLVIQSD